MPICKNLLRIAYLYQDNLSWYEKNRRVNHPVLLLIKIDLFEFINNLNRIKKKVGKAKSEIQTEAIKNAEL